MAYTWLGYPLDVSIARAQGCASLISSLVPSGLLGFQSPTRSLYWTALVLAMAFIAWVCLLRTRWGRAVGWAALALGGQACALQLLWVGPDIRLQLFYGWSTLLRSYQGIFLLALLLQSAIVMWGARTVWPSARAYLPRLISWPRALLLLGVAAYAATTIQPEVAQVFVRSIVGRETVVYATKVVLGLLILGTGALSLALAVHAIPDECWEQICTRWRQLNHTRLPWVCAAWVVAVSCLLAWFALDRMPHVPDEVVYMFEAKYFAAGHLYLPPGPAPDALFVDQQLVDGSKFYGAAPAGWPFVWSLGIWAGVPWLVNPLLGGIAILLTHSLIRRLYDQEVANAAVLLLAGSPWFLFLSASYMPHALALVCALACLLAVAHARENGSIVWATLAGFSVGLLLHTRALEAVVIAAVAGVWWLGAGWKKLRLKAGLTTCFVGLCMAGLYLAYNKALTGNALEVPINRYTDAKFYKGANRLGFGPDVGNFGWRGLDALPGHGPVDVVMNTNQDLYLVNFEMFGWACGSLLFVFLLLVWGGVRGNELMWALVFVTWAAMSLYWFSGGPDFGARYWYQMIVPLTVLTVRGAQAVARRLKSEGATLAGSLRVWAFVALATLFGLANLLPWRSLDKYHNYRGVRPDVRKLEREYHFGRSLVFVRGPAWPDYASAFPFNPPTFERNAPGAIFVRELGPDSDQRLRAYYADRPVWIIAGQSEGHGGLVVVAGPSSDKRPVAQGPLQ
jgi:hypothetical protein